MSAVGKSRIAVFGVLIALMPALGGCGASAERESKQQQSRAAELVAQADAVPTPRLDWAPCAEPASSRYQCAVAAVPLDYAQPNGATIPLAVLRQPAGDPVGRIGTLFTAAGGPGDRDSTGRPLANSFPAR